METRIRYTVTDCLETFPFLPEISAINAIAREYIHVRQEIMSKRDKGLTQIYNRFHNPEEQSGDLDKLRNLHVELDQAVIAGYRWSDLETSFGFHQTKQGVRYTVSDSARRTILDRLLALNHQLHEEEVHSVLDEKKPKGGRIRRTSHKKKTEQNAVQGGLY